MSFYSTCVPLVNLYKIPNIALLCSLILTLIKVLVQLSSSCSCFELLVASVLGSKAWMEPLAGNHCLVCVTVSSESPQVRLLPTDPIVTSILLKLELKMLHMVNMLNVKTHEYRLGTVNLNTVNSKFHLIRNYYEIFFYNFPNIPCLKYTVNSNFHLIRSKTLLTNDFELTVPDLYVVLGKFSLFSH